MAVNAKNDTLRLEGVISPALKFGKYPQLRVPGIENLPRADLAEQSKIADEARREMAKQMANIRLDRALQHKVPEYAQISYKLGDRVVVWRERVYANRIGERFGPFEVASCKNSQKLATV